MKNENEIISELDELKKYISGWDIPRTIELHIHKKVNKIKSLMEVEKEFKDEILFEKETDNACCKIIKTITGEFIFQILMKEDNEIWNSDENGIELDSDGVYSTYEKCEYALNDTYEAFYGKTLIDGLSEKYVSDEDFSDED